MTELLPGVFLKGHGPPSYEECVRAALLWAGPGAAACRQTAASLMGFGDFDRSVIHIGVPKARSCHRREPLI